MTVIKPEDVYAGYRGDLRILIGQQKYKVFLDLVTPSAEPILTLNHFIPNAYQVRRHPVTKQYPLLFNAHNYQINGFGCL